MLTFPNFHTILQWLGTAAYLSVIVLQVWACVILLKERSLASWLMLVGAMLSAAAFVWHKISFRYFLDSSFNPVLIALTMPASLLFFGGLLLHAWKLRPANARLQELESMLAERDRRS